MYHHAETTAPSEPYKDNEDEDDTVWDGDEDHELEELDLG